ncbi:unnamed protein product [Amoebophrya sp. A120]|nr:unnamed protein product [Amoebophrya sp. A120]|eukprot:GSA120T00019483001.1
MERMPEEEENKSSTQGLRGQSEETVLARNNLLSRGYGRGASSSSLAYWNQYDEKLATAALVPRDGEERMGIFRDNEPSKERLLRPSGARTTPLVHADSGAYWAQYPEELVEGNPEQQQQRGRMQSTRVVGSGTQGDAAVDRTTSRTGRAFPSSTAYWDQYPLEQLQDGANTAARKGRYMAPLVEESSQDHIFFGGNRDRPGQQAASDGSLYSQRPLQRDERETGVLATSRSPSLSRRLLHPRWSSVMSSSDDIPHRSRVLLPQQEGRVNMSTSQINPDVDVATNNYNDQPGDHVQSQGSPLEPAEKSNNTSGMKRPPSYYVPQRAHPSEEDERQLFLDAAQEKFQFAPAGRSTRNVERSRLLFDKILENQPGMAKEKLQVEHLSLDRNTTIKQTGRDEQFRKPTDLERKRRLDAANLLLSSSSSASSGTEEEGTKRATTSSTSMKNAPPAVDFQQFMLAEALNSSAKNDNLIQVLLRGLIAAGGRRSVVATNNFDFRNKTTANNQTNITNSTSLYFTAFDKTKRDKELYKKNREFRHAVARMVVTARRFLTLKRNFQDWRVNCVHKRRKIVEQKKKKSVQNFFCAPTTSGAIITAGEKEQDLAEMEASEGRGTKSFISSVPNEVLTTSTSPNFALTSPARSSKIVPALTEPGPQPAALNSTNEGSFQFEEMDFKRVSAITGGSEEDLKTRAERGSGMESDDVAGAETAVLLEESYNNVDVSSPDVRRSVAANKRTLSSPPSITSDAKTKPNDNAPRTREELQQLLPSRNSSLQANTSSRVRSEQEKAQRTSDAFFQEQPVEEVERVVAAKTIAADEDSDNDEFLASPGLTPAEVHYVSDKAEFSKKLSSIRNRTFRSHDAEKRFVLEDEEDLRRIASSKNSPQALEEVDNEVLDSSEDASTEVAAGGRASRSTKENSKGKKKKRPSSSRSPGRNNESAIAGGEALDGIASAGTSGPQAKPKAGGRRSAAVIAGDRQNATISARKSVGPSGGGSSSASAGTLGRGGRNSVGAGGVGAGVGLASRKSVTGGTGKTEADKEQPPAPAGRRSGVAAKRKSASTSVNLLPSGGGGQASASESTTSSKRGTAAGRSSLSGPLAGPTSRNARKSAVNTNNTTDQKEVNIEKIVETNVKTNATTNVNVTRTVATSEETTVATKNVDLKTTTTTTNKAASSNKNTSSNTSASTATRNDKLTPSSRTTPGGGRDLTMSELESALGALTTLYEVRELFWNDELKRNTLISVMDAEDQDALDVLNGRLTAFMERSGTSMGTTNSSDTASKTRQTTLTLSDSELLLLQKAFQELKELSDAVENMEAEEKTKAKQSPARTSSSTTSSLRRSNVKADASSDLEQKIALTRQKSVDVHAKNLEKILFTRTEVAVVEEINQTVTTVEEEKELTTAAIASLFYQEMERVETTKNSAEAGKGKPATKNRRLRGPFGAR